MTKMTKMNLIKTLTRYALYTLLALFGFAIWYFATAFVIMEINPANWSAATRFLVITWGMLTSVGIVTLTHLTISKQNY